MSHEFSGSTENPVAKEEITRFLTMNDGSTLKEHTEGYRLPADRFTYFSIDPEISNTSVRTIFGAWSPAQNKSYTGDGLVVCSKGSEGKLVLGTLDGQTPVAEMDTEKYGKLLRYCTEGQRADFALTEMLRANPWIIEQGFKYNTSYFGEDKEISDELVFQSYSQKRDYLFGRKEVGEIVNIWANINAGFNIVNGIDPHTIRFEPQSKRPGLTGTLAELHENELSFVSLADSPVFLIGYNGTLNPFYISSNTRYDRMSVTKMRLLISEGRAGDSQEAKRILLDEGYYARSYEEKINRRAGGVPVCNGSENFYLSIPDEIKINIANYAAVVFMTDGMLYHLQDVDTGLNSRGVEEMVRRLIKGNLGYLEMAEKRSFNTYWPSRERLSDDKSALVMSNLTRIELLELSEQLDYPF